MKFIDFHCDTLMPFAFGEPFSISENNKHLDIKRMKKGGALAQFFAMFLIPDGSWERRNLQKVEEWEYIRILSEGFRRDIEENKDIIAFAGNYDDLKANEAAGKMSAFLTIEDGRLIEGNMDNLKKVYDMGVRLISLTWNFPNCFGYPNSKDAEVMGKGLTPFGIEAIQVMNDMGMIIDVSHLSDGGFMDVAKYSKVPFVASHSNCRALSPHQRNLTDDMIKILGEKGGFAGINFGPEFLSEDVTCKDSKVEFMSKHILRMKNIGGIEVVGLGSDFDGVGGNMEIDSVDKMHLLFDQMKKDGFSEDEIEKVAYKNAERIIKASMK